MSVTKAELIDALYEEAGVARQDAARMVDMFFEELKACLEAGNDVKLSGFGNFELRNKKPRKGRNPQTGEVLRISGRRVLVFKPSHVLRQFINGDGDHGEE